MTVKMWFPWHLKEGVHVPHISLMRRSNCSALPTGSPWVRGKMCVIKQGGALKTDVKKGRSTGK